MSGTVHTYPEGDVREHVTDDEDFCPCLPWRSPEDPDVLIHNSYDGREIGEVARKALDLLGLALVAHHHAWTVEERFEYERAFDLLERHYPAPEEAPA